MPSLTEVQEVSLLDRIKLRDEKQTKFGYGILTADRWVKNMQQAVGLDACYKFASKRSVSFDDALRKASQTLTYSNPEMVVSEKTTDTTGLGIDLPKNTLMVFKHVLTTPRKDRDGDILRTEGAQLDPRMLLLWQHVHTLPIGKMLGVVEHTKDQLVLMSAIVDMNELSQDAATMIDNDMGRFSHGFKALEWEEIKSEDSEWPEGFDIKSFEIMEESLVSVPSNADAEVSEVMLSMVEGGKLTSGIMKEYGKQIRSEMPIKVVAGISLTEEKSDEDESGDRSTEAEGIGEKGTEICTPEETKEPAEEVQTDTTENTNVAKWIITMTADGPMEEEKSLEETPEEPMSEPLVEEREITATEAMAVFLAKASSEEKSKMLSVLKMFAELEEQENKSKQFKEFLSS